MALVVGDLLSDANAQSFVSAEDADAYLGPEANAAWDGATAEQREAALVVASRWLLASIPWAVDELDEDELAQVGRVAARVAVEALGRDLMAVTDSQSQVKRETVGPITVEYRDTRGGLVFPWLRPMLRGIATAGGGVPVVRV